MRARRHRLQAGPRFVVAAGQLVVPDGEITRRRGRHYARGHARTVSNIRSIRQDARSEASAPQQSDWRISAVLPSVT